MLLSPPLSLFSTQLAKKIQSPAEGEVVALVTVEFVEGFEFRVGNDKIWTGSVSFAWNKYR